MKVKYSPCKSDKDTSIKYINDNTIEIDGKHYEFDIDSVQFPQLDDLTDYAILEAHRDENSELYLTVRRFYTDTCKAWDTGDYHDIKG